MWETCHCHFLFTQSNRPTHACMPHSSHRSFGQDRTVLTGTHRCWCIDMRKCCASVCQGCTQRPLQHAGMLPILTLTSPLMLHTNRAKWDTQERENRPAATQRRWMWGLLSGQTVFHQLTRSHWACKGIHWKQKHSHHGSKMRSRDSGVGESYKKLHSGSLSIDVLSHTHTHTL